MKYNILNHWDSKHVSIGFYKFLPTPLIDPSQSPLCITPFLQNFPLIPISPLILPRRHHTRWCKTGPPSVPCRRAFRWRRRRTGNCCWCPPWTYWKWRHESGNEKKGWRIEKRNFLRWVELGENLKIVFLQSDTISGVNMRGFWMFRIT